MATISNTPRPGYVWDATDNVWYPIGVGGHSHSEIAKTIADAKGDLIVGTAADTVDRLAVGNNGETLVADSSTSTGLRYNPTVEAGKNRIINGAMTIDQRNNGASVTVNTSNATYVLDRFVNFGQPTDGVYTVQRDTTAPSGFSNSLKATVTTADASIGATQFYLLQQYIEGYNVADFAYGTAAAKTITLSFWVRSSVTGTFGGSFRNAAQNRSYPYSYTISAADTWEKKSVVVAGDTTGTWDNTSGRGLNVIWSLGDGVDRLGTAGAWAAANLTGVTGQTNLIATSGATWFITGVQVELGSVATAFSNAGGTIQGELAACQRYYYRQTAAGITEPYAFGSSYNTTGGYVFTATPVTMRVKPTSIEFSNVQISDWINNFASTPAIGFCVNNQVWLSFGGTGLTAFRPYILNASSATSYLAFNAEL
jgi:hypothetical protein